MLNEAMNLVGDDLGEVVERMRFLKDKNNETPAPASTVSIGYMRNDGSFRLVATLNNNDEELPQSAFDSITQVIKKIHKIYGTKVAVLSRIDAPDFVDL